jgi:uncharacterized membrane protein
MMAAVAASGISCLLLLVQVQEAHQYHYWYMAWNLILAWIPMVLAMVFGAAAVQRRGGLVRLVLFATWLLFLPNAPYMVTDVIHLRYSPIPLVQYVMFAAFAATGLVLGLGSAYIMHCALLLRWKREPVVALVYGCLVTCGIGLYVGRVVQLNSWDVVVAPDKFAHAVGSHVDNLDGVADAVLFVAVVASVLVLTYFIFSRFAGGAKTQG